MKLVILFIAIFIVQVSTGQTNLVSNYSFEDYIVCPTPSNGLLPPPPGIPLPMQKAGEGVQMLATQIQEQLYQQMEGGFNILELEMVIWV